MIPLVLSVLGTCAALIYLLLFREILPVFQSNDIVIGIFLAHCVISFAAGVYAASFNKNPKNPGKVIFYSLLLLAAFFVLSFISVRYARTMFYIGLGNGISLKTTVIHMFAVLFPLSFMNGVISFSTLPFIKKYGVKTPIKTSFMFQGAGILLGSAFYSLFFIDVTGLKAVLSVTALLFLSAALISDSKKKGIILIVSAVAAALLIPYGFINTADKFLLGKEFSGAEVADYAYSPYGQTVLVQKNNEYFLLANGILRFSSPDNDVLNSEDFGHIPVLHHKNPEKVLIIGGAAKYLPMILEHDVSRVDYVEPNGVNIIKNNISHLGYVFSDERVNVYSEDARSFIKKTGENYDLIQIGLPNPITLHINSFYTKDFFELAKKRLNNDGFLALKLPGNMAFSSYIMAELNKSVMEAMQSVFSYVQIIPGGQNILIASQNRMPYRLHIKKRLKEMQETTLVLSKYYLDDRMDTERTRWLKNELNRVEKNDLVNRDWHPVAMVLAVLHWQSAFSPYLSVALDKIIEYSYFVLILIIIIFFLSKSIYKTTAFVSGASALWLNLTAVLSLQVYNGQIFKWGGIFAALFLSGLILGVIYAKKTSENAPLSKRIFASELIFVIWMTFWFISFKFNIINMYVLFLFMAGTGFVAGMEFTLLIMISKLFNSDPFASLKVYIYGAAGSWFACALGSFLIPAWGMEKAVLFILFLKFLIFCRWADIYKRGL